MRWGDAEDVARSAGARVVPSMSHQVTLLVAGQRAGSKLQDAKKKGIEIVEEKAFLRRVGANRGGYA
jgi:DNA ligase (NAD+)